MTAGKRPYDMLVQKLRGGGDIKSRPDTKELIAANKKTYKKAIKDFGLNEEDLVNIPVEDQISMAQFVKIWGKADAVARYHIRSKTGLITIVGVDPEPPHHLILSRKEAESVAKRQAIVDAGGIDPILRMSHNAKPDTERYRAYFTLPFGKDYLDEGREFLISEGTSIELIIAEAITAAVSRKRESEKKKPGKKAV